MRIFKPLVCTLTLGIAGAAWAAEDYQAPRHEFGKPDLSGCWMVLISVRGGATTRSGLTLARSLAG